MSYFDSQRMTTLIPGPSNITIGIHQNKVRPAKRSRGAKRSKEIVRTDLPLAAREGIILEVSTNGNSGWVAEAMRSGSLNMDFESIPGKRGDPQKQAKARSRVHSSMLPDRTDVLI